jgi:hypothetical protein
MPYVLVRHKVEDYNKWSAVFFEHGVVRANMGFKGGHIFRNVDDTNEVVILLEVDGLEKARQVMQSEGLRKTMQRVGVIGQPDICFLEEVTRPSACIDRR